MDDIVPSLLEAIQEDFKKQWKSNKTVAKTWEKIKSKKATYEDANDFSIAIGEMLEKSYKKYISADTLPEGRMWYNIATRILEPTLYNNYSLISKVCTEAQKNVNDESGIGMNPVAPEYNTSRVSGLIDKISNAEHFEDVEWLLGEPVVNFSQSVVDDSIERNAKLQASSGLTPKIRRTLAPSEKRSVTRGHKKISYNVPCPWCAALAGVYDYPNVPRDVFRRHENCRCTLEYVVGGKKLNPWYTKTVWEEDRQERIEETERLHRNYETKEDIRKALMQDVGFNSVEDRLFNNNLELMKLNTEQLVNLEEKFGAIRKSSGYITSSNSGNAIAYIANSVYTPTRQNMSLCNSSYRKSMEEFLKGERQMVESFWAMPCAEEKLAVFSVTHEYGHALQNVLLQAEMEKRGWSASTPFSMMDRTKKTQKARDKFYIKTDEEFSKRCFNEIVEIAKSNNSEFSLKDNLSRYGRSNYHEFFAEVFANSQCGEPNELGKAMIEWLVEKGF